MQILPLTAKLSSSIVRFGGLAAILGGIVWLLLLIPLQLQMCDIVQVYEIHEPPCCDFMLLYSLNNQVLVVPILLFMVGLMALYWYVSPRLAQSKLLVASGILAFSGIFLIIAHITEWLVLWWYGGYGGLIGPGPPPVEALWMLWYATFGPGIALLASGLALFGFVTRKTSLLPNSQTVILIISSLAVSVMPLFIKSSLEDELEASAALNNSDLFMIVLVLFGVAWIALGIALFRRAYTVAIPGRFGQTTMGSQTR
jgi:hypothetical protein